MRTISLIVAIVGSVFFSVPASADDKRRLPTTFQVLEYNSVASNYLPRPTFVDAVVKNDEIKELYIRADFITGSEHTAFTRGMELHWVKKKHLAEYMSGVGKFLEWEDIASRDGDMFTKVIGKFGKARFTFHSGSQSTHYLEITKCSACAESAYYYDRDGAEGLMKLLRAWQENRLDTLSPSEIEDKYK